MKKKLIDKTYHAVTIGNMEKQGSIALAIDTKPAITNYSIQDTVISERFQFLNLVLLQPKTGRKHQIRKHLLSIKSPILGDQKYFLPELKSGGKGLYLCATGLIFSHPFTKQLISINRDLPKKFKKIFAS
ncbi:pseudouridine synthase [Tenacibaculum sp. SG-28]|uniref:pseudouridine synthase n=1 Tax=Tenacibaculum sp. SG-28 TaxID=754426 RepID=UPI0035158AEF